MIRQPVADANGWEIAQDGEKWRRVVASPTPREIPDTGVIQLLLDTGVVVICTGGGGIPLIRQGDGSLTGIEAVVDKDASSAQLAQLLGANVLLLLTDVDRVYQGFGTEKAVRIPGLSSKGTLQFDRPAGSMRPELKAVATFARTSGVAGIGRMQGVIQIMKKDAGSIVTD